MSDPVELILDFLRRHQFDKAEAAFKAELLTRDDEGRLLSPRLQLHCPSNVHGVAGNAGEQKLTSPLERNNLGDFKSKEAGFLSEEGRPPEKHLYVEYEPGRTCQDVFGSPLQESAFEEASIIPEYEAPSLLVTEDLVSFPIQAVDHVVQGASYSSLNKQEEAACVCTESRNSEKPLYSLRQVESKQDECATRRCNEVTYKQQESNPTNSFPATQIQSQHQETDSDVVDPHMPRLLCDICDFPSPQGKSKKPAYKREDKATGSDSNIGGRQVVASKNRIEHYGEESLQVHNLLSYPLNVGAHKDSAPEILFPLSLPKASSSLEQRRSIRLEKNSLVNGNAAMDGENFQAVTLQAMLSESPGPRSEFETLELHSTSVHESGELPRLAPVRLHSIDKSMDVSKNDDLYADCKNFRRTLEFRVVENDDGVMNEDTLGWHTLPDTSHGLDLPTSGSKRSIFRPSVSQGIVGALSDYVPGFSNAADGWYPDDYCDSDTYEDDDDPGYHRQPIEDEDWFLAHEIDYPSDDERARQLTDKHAVKDIIQLMRADEEEQPHGEEESYFSGEEYYRLQAAKKEASKPQQSELRSIEDEHLALIDAADNDQLIFLGVDHGRENNQGQTFDAEELLQMRSQPVWKGFIGHSVDHDEDNTNIDSCKVNADGIDDDNHGSVRSGGIFVSSDKADVGSEVRDSLLGGSSEGDLESLRDQELAISKLANRSFDSINSRSNELEGPREVRSASIQHLEEGNSEHDMVLQYYNEVWGLCKRATEREFASSTFEAKELFKSKHSIGCRNMGLVDNGGSLFQGFSFPSPSSTGQLALSTAGSGESLRSNRQSTAQANEIDGYSSGLVGPDDTLAAWKLKSNNSSPIICSSEDNLQKFDLPDILNGSFQPTESVEAQKHDKEVPEIGCQLLMCQPSNEEEGTLAGQDDIGTLSANDDQYEVFNLRIIHRKNRTGFEEDKDIPVLINSVIAGRYHVTEYLGSAAFSKAIQAHDLHTGMDVCMKIIKNNKDFFDQSLDEIKLLKFVNQHDPVDNYHILRLYDYFYHREHLFIVCELLRANLYEFHKFNRESGGEVYFTMPRLQSITRQCLEALEFLHRLGIIHCDLKPENILVKSYSRCEIKIIDLGSSCFQTDHLCSYVQSRSYRAPEVILGLPYDQKIDIWSLGCILAELCTGNVLFQNDSLATLVARVVGILGPIDPEVLAKGRDTCKFFTKKHMIYERNQETGQLEYLIPKRTSLSHRLPMGDPGFVEFVRYLLESNPCKRPIAAEALRHPWLAFPYEPLSS